MEVARTCLKRKLRPANVTHREVSWKLYFFARYLIFKCSTYFKNNKKFVNLFSVFIFLICSEYFYFYSQYSISSFKLLTLFKAVKLFEKIHFYIYVKVVQLVKDTDKYKQFFFFFVSNTFISKIHSLRIAAVKFFINIIVYIYLHIYLMHIIPNNKIQLTLI